MKMNFENSFILRILSYSHLFSLSICLTQGISYIVVKLVFPLSFFFFLEYLLVLLFYFLNFIFKLYKMVLVLPNIEMNPPQVYMCSPSWTLLPPPSPYHPSGSSQCTSPKHPVSCMEPGLVTRFIHDIIRVSVPFSPLFPPAPSFF